MSESTPGTPSQTFDSLPPLRGPRRKLTLRDRSLLAGDSRVAVGPGVIVSVLAHVLMFGGALAYAHYSPPRVVPEKPIVAKLVRLGKPRDEKLLPRLPSAPPPPPPPTSAAPVVAPANVPPPSPTAKAVPVPAKPAPPREETPAERQARLMAAFNSLGAPGPTTTEKPEELAGKADGDPNGTADDAAEGDRYVALVVELLKKNYVVPTTVTQRERLFLSCKLRLFIGAGGEIDKFEIVQGSGNEQFDRAVEASIQGTKLPPPPEAFTSRFGRSGLPFDFKP